MKYCCKNNFCYMMNIFNERDDFVSYNDESNDDIVNNVEDSSLFTPKKRDIYKALVNETKKNEFARLFFKIKRKKILEDYFDAVPMVEVSKNIFIFKVDGKLKKFNLSDLEIMCK